MLGINQIYNQDCLEGMKLIDDKSIDLVLCDLPYGTTKCKWDIVIPFKLLWQQYERIIKDNGAIVLFGSQPFTSALVMSNLKLFKYSLVWDKVNRYTGALNANKMPLRRHEDVLVFYRKQPTYNKQYREGKPYTRTTYKGHGEFTNYGQKREQRVIENTDGNHNPCSIIAIEGINKNGGLHPTQKNTKICEWLIRTYSNEGDLILDNCIGSGSTAVAALNTNRNFIGFELEEKYFNIAQNRIAEAYKQASFFNAHF